MFSVSVHNAALKSGYTVRSATNDEPYVVVSFEDKNKNDLVMFFDDEKELEKIADKLQELARHLASQKK